MASARRSSDADDGGDDVRVTLTAEAVPPEVRGSTRSSSVVATESGLQRPATAPTPERVLIQTLSPGERQALAEQEEHLAAVHRLRRGVGYGTIVWCCFASMDWVLATYVVPSDVSFYWTLRGIGAVAAFGMMALLRKDPPVGRRALAAIDVLVFTGISVLVTLMSFASGGLSSPYAQGIVTVLVVRSIVLQSHWRETALRLGGPAAAYPLLVLASAPFSETLSAQLRVPRELGAFALNLGFILVAYGFMVAAGHAVWALRMQVYASRSLGGYRLEQKLGSGGMGEVWSAQHLVLRRRVAVKIMRVSGAAEKSQTVARFEREVRATAELDHPNVVRVYDGGVTEDGLWYYAMELLEGADLASMVSREGALAARRALDLVSQAARGLAAAHAHGVVHRDVKPENLFVIRDRGREQVKVVDFGIAKLLGEEREATLTRTGLLMGTPLYLSPEAARGALADERSDLYSLGCVLYFALTGTPPHEDRNAGALVFAHTHLDPEPPSERALAPLPSALDTITMRCLQKDPAKRYPSMAALADALDDARDALDTSRGTGSAERHPELALG